MLDIVLKEVLKVYKRLQLLKRIYIFFFLCGATVAFFVIWAWADIRIIKTELALIPQMKATQDTMKLFMGYDSLRKEYHWKLVRVRNDLALNSPQNGK